MVQLRSRVYTRSRTSNFYPVTYMLTDICCRIQVARSGYMLTVSRDIITIHLCHGRLVSGPLYPATWRRLDGSLHLTSDIDTRRRLRSADTATLVVLSTDHSMLGDRAIPVAVAATRAWNSLPPSVRNAPSLILFRRTLKTVLLQSSFSD